MSKAGKKMVKQVVVFGSEIWAMAEMGMKELGTWETKIFRRVYGPVVEQGMWRVGSDQELRELYNDLDIVADVKKKRFKWIGHVVRMDQGRTVKIFESKREGSRRRGRPRVRWLEYVEKDVGEMKVKRWRQKAVDREEWASVIKGAKAVIGS